MWGFENLDVEPDVFSSAKALGAGVPIGAMMCKVCMLMYDSISYTYLQ